MIQGERPEGPLFPLVWSADGRRESTESFPHGFATRWTRARKADVNEYDLFAKNLADSRAQEKRS